jgi:hypothetical protein
MSIYCPFAEALGISTTVSILDTGYRQYDEEGVLIPPWNKGKKGLQVAWNKGLKMGPVPKEVVEKRSNTIREKYKTQPHYNLGKDPWNKGKKGVQSAWNKGKPAEKTECPHCGKLVDTLNMKKWHGDKCKLRVY